MTIELDLLRRADVLARAAAMKRSELFTQGLQVFADAEERVIGRWNLSAPTCQPALTAQV